MKKCQAVFARYEKKYLLNRTDYAKMRRALEGIAQTDQYGQHTICNIYYDTNDFSLIRASLEKPVYKEKLRLRSYGVPAPEDTVFLELKKKFKGVVYKRREAMNLAQAKAYLAAGLYPAGQGQILKEIDWFRSFYRPEPKVFIAYDRIAMAGIADEELRITFDTNIRYRTDALDLAAGDEGQRLTGHDEFLMEIKVMGAMPLHLVRLLDGLGICPTSFSKYGYCYQQKLMQHPKILLPTTKGGIICA